MRDFHKPNRSSVFAMNGVVSTSHPLAARVGASMLERGGNAMDAAVATGVLLGLCEPAATGIGGDMFAMIKPAGEDRLVGFNASGRAPKALNAAMLRDQGETSISLDGVHSISVPGAIDGFCRLAADWGRLGLAACLEPAISYAEQGVPVAPRVGFDYGEMGHRLQGDGARHFLNDGQPFKPGEVMRYPGQAEVLRQVAEKGRAGFYEGAVMEDMLASLKALGGMHEAADFVENAPDYVDPISAMYRDYELCELPPNGQGATALLIAKILNHFDLSGLDPFGAERAHIEAEATRLGYDARDRFIADFTVAGPLMEHMLADETAAKLANMIDRKRANRRPSTDAVHMGAVHRDTVYLTAADRDGMMVSMIYSVFWPFGSGHASAKYGVPFQNRGAGFVLTEGHPNELHGGKRPLHTIIPAMVKKDDKVVISYGVMGGQYQCTGHVRMLSNVVDYGMDPQGAQDAPRCFADPDGRLHIERGYAEEVRNDLAARGHEIHVPATPIGGSQMIRRHENGVYEAGSDPRKDGCAIGL